MIETGNELHTKTGRRVAPSAYIYVDQMGHEDWKVFSQIRSKDHDDLPAVLTREQIKRLLSHIRLRRYRIPIKLLYCAASCQPSCVENPRWARHSGAPSGPSPIAVLRPWAGTFRWKDRANGDEKRTDTISGVEFVRRTLRHVLPRGMRAIRYDGFCHPAAKRKRERIAFHTGRPLLIGALANPLAKPKPVHVCPCCGGEMKIIASILPPWRHGRAPPRQKQRCA